MLKIIPGITNSTGLFMKAKTMMMMEEYNNILLGDFVYDKAATGMGYSTHDDFFTSLKGWKNYSLDSKFTIHRTTQ
eukprot:4156398-Ditylum_brightwellii.AAC.2